MTDDEIFERLIRDMLVAYKAGRYLIDMNYLGIVLDDGVYEPMDENCSMCAVGAAMVGREGRPQSLVDDFAALVGRRREWAVGFYEGSTPSGMEPTEWDDPELEALAQAGYDLARRVVAWVDQEQRPGGKLA